MDSVIRIHNAPGNPPQLYQFLGENLLGFKRDANPQYCQYGNNQQNTSCKGLFSVMFALSQFFHWSDRELQMQHHETKHPRCNPKGTSIKIRSIAVPTT